MTRSQHPPCAGSQFYGAHSAKVPDAYTVICPGGSVVYCCDTDCLERFLADRRDRPLIEALRGRRSAS
jgi:hypothetical protein